MIVCVGVYIFIVVFKVFLGENLVPLGDIFPVWKLYWISLNSYIVKV